MKRRGKKRFYELKIFHTELFTIYRKVTKKNGKTKTFGILNIKLLEEID